MYTLRMPTMTPVLTKERDGEGFMQTGTPRKCGWSRVFLNAGRFLCFRPPFRVSVPRLGIALSFHPHLDYCISETSHPLSSVQHPTSPHSSFLVLVFLIFSNYCFLDRGSNTSDRYLRGTRERHVFKVFYLRQLQGKNHAQLFTRMGIKQEPVNNIWYA